MGAASDFRRQLNKLVDKRTRWLYGVLDNPYMPRTERLDRARVNRAVLELQELASNALSERLAKKHFHDSTDPKLSWRVSSGKGRGPDQKMATFMAWYRHEVRKSTCIYVFWKQGRAIYVGKTQNGAGRPAGHFVKHWFAGVTSIDVYPVRGKRPLPALECLAIHRFQPSRNKFAAETKRWTDKCPLCAIHQEIDEQLRDIVR